MEKLYTFKKCLKNNWWLYAIAVFKFWVSANDMRAEGMSNWEIFLVGLIGFGGITLVIFIYWYIRYGRK
ncbi:MAG: hypothetical protein US50_C0017G0004 [Candidatus Nomurabacteria bacterium GW2011_GWB1_37_5]|uniref:Uncharacterized protein n=1 Tax=Candidatus Nomurabacteria bacterium GW2011_GWB1_37_5 TaxID=1618742 RepID=A0A0G0GWG5_9BACT|nr:MAG: hypothetical protein US50_C0017G0004 [Candidatus Nomurabacteria bacterium GW2011_GWB1_37_5]